ncbi:MAG: glycosyltransferase family 2 protein [Patescibacteria group bacterium]
MISIIIPAYNEENSIKDTVHKVYDVCEESFKDYEIVVVNDGSTDKTASVLESLNLSHLIILNRGFNKGYGASLKEGIGYAKGEIIAITDADGTYPIEKIPQLVSEVERGFSMSVAARRGRYKNTSLIRAVPKLFLDKIANVVAGQKILDINSGLRAFRKKDVLPFFNIISDKFSFTTTITLSYLSNGLSVSYLPIEYKKRVGKSKVKAKDALDFLSLILRTIMYFNPLRIFAPTAIFLMGMGFLKFVYDLFNEPFLNITPSVIFVFLSGLQILAIGMLADLIKSTRGK